MSGVVFRGPTGTSIVDPSERFLRGLIIWPPEGYWEQGSGDAELELRVGEGGRLCLLILPNTDLGIYLKMLRIEAGRVVETWLSQWDKNRLTEVVTCSDEWFASAGLFVPPSEAADAIAEFARTGGRASCVDWIQPSEIPEGGNW